MLNNDSTVTPSALRYEKRMRPSSRERVNAERAAVAPDLGAQAVVCVHGCADFE
jgi:hypothetical protein